MSFKWKTHRKMDFKGATFNCGPYRCYVVFQAKRAWRYWIRFHDVDMSTGIYGGLAWSEEDAKKRIEKFLIKKVKQAEKQIEDHYAQARKRLRKMKDGMGMSK
jgi:hypothetical protein